MRYTRRISTSSNNKECLTVNLYFIKSTILLSATRQKPSYFVSLGGIILSSHLLPVPPDVLFPFGFPTKILYAFLISFVRTTWLRQSHLPLQHIKYLAKNTNYGVLYPPITCSLLHPNISLGTLFSNTLNVCLFSLIGASSSTHITHVKLQLLYFSLHVLDSPSR
jgi:hypothetical protein